MSGVNVLELQSTLFLRPPLRPPSFQSEPRPHFQEIFLQSECLHVSESMPILHLGQVYLKGRHLPAGSTQCVSPQLEETDVLVLNQQEGYDQFSGIAQNDVMKDVPTFP